MKSLLSKIEATWGVKKEFRSKVFFLTSAFFMLTACQAIWRPLKNAVFISIVGVKNIPDAKFFLMFPIIILIILYSKLVDWLRRHQLFYWFTISHAIAGLFLCYFLAHPTYGIANTAQSSSRIFGWVFYFFMESFGAFMSASFWSFANSINTPKDAKRYYGLFVSGSKIGGILGASSMYLAMTHLGANGAIDNRLIPFFMFIGCFLLLGAAGCIYLLMKHVPGYLMHGYEAAYQYEKKKEQQKLPWYKSLAQAFEGVFSIFKTPYVFGIFGIIFSYEIIIVIIDFLMALAASAGSPSPQCLAAFYASYMLLMHSIGLIIALFGTAPIQRFLGIRLSLFASPILSLFILPLIFLFPTNISILFYSIVVLRALNYGLNHPTREALFIPTTKAIKFKSKAWTDAFGSRFSKASGSLLNKFVLLGIVQRSSIACTGITFIWIALAYVLGKTYKEAVDNDRVIGADNETSS